ncbi:MAG TPA: hypothetical protein DCG28_00725 [Lachnospiraceae bacterium]|nr:hypothetical protein [Lachnospiraceae bacterium]
MFEPATLKQNAKALLKTCYWPAVLVSLIMAFTGGGGGGGGSFNTGRMGQNGGSDSLSRLSGDQIAAIAIIVLIVFVVVLAISCAIMAFVFGPLNVGCTKFFLNCRYNTAKVADVAFVFGHTGYKNVAKTMFLKYLYIVLWSLLFIIPGIVKAYEYFLVPYILADDPNTPCEEAFAKSKEIMTGQKMNVFLLHLSFIGWFILGIFTLGLLNLFYVNPYVNLTNSELYYALKAKNEVVSGFYDNNQM